MQEFYNAMATNGCLFIGAGISKLIGFPLWREFASKILDFTWGERERFQYKSFNLSEKEELIDWIQREKLIDVITFCKDIFKENNFLEEYYKYIENTFNDPAKYSSINNEAYAALHKLSCRLFFLQTNIDYSLEIYFATANKTASQTFMNRNLPLDIGRIPPGTIIYLHGKATQRGTIIFTTDEYNDFYEKQTLLREFLVKLFNGRTVLFLGYSLSDKEILETVARSISSKTHYLALANKRRDETKNKLFSELLDAHYNIKTIQYDVEAGYEKIIEFINDISSEIYRVVPSHVVPSDDRSVPI